MQTRFGWVVALLGSLTMACSKPEPIQESHTGKLEQGDLVLEDDGSLYDEYKFKVGEGMNIQVTMESTDFDTHLLLVDAANEKVGEDDDGGGGPNGTDSKLVMVAPKSGEYRVFANSHEAGSTGTYKRSIVTTAASQ